MERPQAKYHRAVQEEHRLDNRIGQGRSECSRPARAVQAHVAADVCRDLTDAGRAGDDAKADKAHARTQLFGQRTKVDFLLRLDPHVLAYNCNDVARAAVPARPLAVIVELHGLGYGMLGARNLVVPDVDSHVRVGNGRACVCVPDDVSAEHFGSRRLIVRNRDNVVNCNGTQYDKFAVREAPKSYVSVRRRALRKTLVLNP